MEHAGALHRAGLPAVHEDSSRQGCPVWPDKLGEQPTHTQCLCSLLGADSSRLLISCSSHCRSVLRLTFFIITDPAKVRGGVCCAETAKHTVPTFTFARHDAGALSEPTFAGTGWTRNRDRVLDERLLCVETGVPCSVLTVLRGYGPPCLPACLVQKPAVCGQHAQAASVPCSRWSRGGTDGRIVA